MAEEVNEVIQVIELLGRGVGAGFRGISGAYRFANWSDAKAVQFKAKLIYASTGKHKTLRVRELLKLTNNTGIISLRTEDEDMLIRIYDDLKKARCNFAEMPDLAEGDGWTQIMFDNADADRIRFVLEKWKEQVPYQGMSLEEYEKSGGVAGLQKLTQDALDGYTLEAHKNQLEDIRKKLEDPAWSPVTINMDTLLETEYKDRYITSVPGTWDEKKSRYRYRLSLSKEDCLLLDGKKSILTFLPTKDMIETVSGEKVPAHQLLSNYNPLSEEHVKQLHMIDETYDVFPSFEQGQSEVRSALSVTDWKKGLADSERKVFLMTPEQVLQTYDKDIDFKLSEDLSLRVAKQDVYRTRSGAYGFTLQADQDVVVGRKLQDPSQPVLASQTISMEELEELHPALTQPVREELLAGIKETQTEAVTRQESASQVRKGESEISRRIVEELTTYQKMKEKKEKGYLPFCFSERSIVAESSESYRVALPSTPEEIGTPTIRVPKQNVLEYEPKNFLIQLDAQESCQVDHMSRDGAILSSENRTNYAVCQSKKDIRKASETLEKTMHKLRYGGMPKMR